MKPIALKIAGLHSFREEQVIPFEQLSELGVFGRQQLHLPSRQRALWLNWIKSEKSMLRRKRQLPPPMTSLLPHFRLKVLLLFCLMRTPLYR